MTQERRVVAEYNVYYNADNNNNHCFIKFKEQFGSLIFRESQVRRLRVRPQHNIYELVLQVPPNANSDARRVFLSKRLDSEDCADVDTFVFRGETDAPSMSTSGTTGTRLALGVVYGGEFHITPINSFTILFEFYHGYKEKDKRNINITPDMLKKQQSAANDRIKLSYTRKMIEINLDNWIDLDWDMCDESEFNEKKMSFFCPEEAMEQPVLSEDISLSASGSSSTLIPASSSGTTLSSHTPKQRDISEYVCLASRAMADKAHREEEKRVYGTIVTYCLHSQERGLAESKPASGPVPTSSTASTADGNTKQLKVSRYESPFFTQLPFLPLLERLKALLLQAHVMKFSDVMNVLRDTGYRCSAGYDGEMSALNGTGDQSPDRSRARFDSGGSLSEHRSGATPASDSVVLKHLQEIAVLVQGCWVIKSELVFTENDSKGANFVTAEKLQMARDYVLWNFHMGRYLTRKEVICAVKLPALQVTRILNQCAQRRLDQSHSRVNRWEFKGADPKFLKRYPHIVEQDLRSWEAKIKWICDKLQIEPPAVRVEDKQFSRGGTGGRRRRRTSSGRSISESSGGEGDESGMMSPGHAGMGKRRRTSSSSSSSNPSGNASSRLLLRLNSTPISPTKRSGFHSPPQPNRNS